MLNKESVPGMGAHLPSTDASAEPALEKPLSTDASYENASSSASVARPAAKATTPDGVARVLDAALFPGTPPYALPTPTANRYDQEQSRDRARATITYWLLALLTALLFGAFIAFFAIRESATFANLKTLLDMLTTPLIVLVSAATGFYFGANSANKINKSNKSNKS